MGKALYRTYRSSSFDEVLGQEHVTSTLKNAINNGHINHAYLLTGPRGVGKTSVARILAHAVNKLDYSQDRQHIDIIEIDAASNRRIDEIRELRERVMIAPVSAKYKVYIIDEVHMLTREAFNALLKTLEEPPGHVIFILATTEFHKLPDTIISRCLRFNFKPINIDISVAHLRYISESEGLKIEDSALELIARHGDGSFRDSISQLDQIRGLGGNVGLGDVQRMLGVAPDDKIQSIFNMLSSGSAAHLLEELKSLRDYGVSAVEISKQLSSLIRNNLIANNTGSDHVAMLRLLKQLLEVQASGRPNDYLELILLDTLLASAQPGYVKKEAAAPNNIELEQKLAPIPLHPPKVDDLTSEEVIKKPGVNSIEGADNLWQPVLLALKAKNNTLYSIARMAHAEFGSDKLILSFTFAFHHKQCSELKNRKLITDIVQSQYPHITIVDIELASKDKDVKVPQKKQVTTHDQTLSSITNIFGGGEVLES